MALTIVMPMAGRGARFLDAGYSVPKPLIPVHGVPMFIRVLENLPRAPRVVLVARDEFRAQVIVALRQHGVDPGTVRCMGVGEVTEGAACTVLLARNEIEDDDELLIANADQWLDWSPEHFHSYCRTIGADGVIPTFRASGPKWSYAAIDDMSVITQVVEKVQISSDATCGLYYFRQARFCWQAIESMIKKNLRVNGEYYLAPAYNEMIVDGAKVVPYPVPRMFGMGTPEDLRVALANAPFEPTDYERPMMVQR